jgi:hypothetical protein
VPVAVENLRDAVGDFPNLNFNDDTSRMTKRFFVLDTISGITDSGGSLNDATPKYVRIANKVKLTV